MKKSISVIILLCLISTTFIKASANQAISNITVRLDSQLGTIDPKIYGHFTELTLSSFEGSVWSELLFNRKFEAPEERDISQIIFNGTAAAWEPIVIDTKVSLTRDTQVFYSPSASQRITLSEATDIPAGIQQSGYQYIMPHLSRNQRVADPFRFKPGESYLVRIAVRQKGFQGAVHVALGEAYQKSAAKISFRPEGKEGWRVFTGELKPAALVENGKFMIYIDSPGTVWVDSISLVRANLNDAGFRKDAIELTKSITPTMIRWPGGWFVSDYHWKDAIGPIDQRPASFNRAWNAYTSNDIGTDEFIALSRKLGAEPYISVNVGTGTPEEAAQWVEYCNGDAKTEMGRLRALNGHPEPYNVKYWSIGNEEYLPTLGGTDGRQYGRNFNAFASAMRAKDPSLKLVAVGAFDIPKGVIGRDHPVWKIVRYLPDWTKETLAESGNTLDYYSLHYYAPENVQGIAPDDVNLATMVIAEDLKRKLERVWKQMEQFAPNGKRYPIALDEWSLKVENDATPRQLPPGVTEISQLGLHMGALTLRDALAEATIFNLLHQYPKDFILGSRSLLYAYLVGLIPIRRDRAIATPVALMMQLYSTRDLSQSLKTEVTSEAFSTKTINPGFAEVKDAKYLDVSARLRSDGKTVELFVVNRNLKQPIDCELRFTGGSIGPNVEVETLNASDLMAGNTFAEPNRVTIERKQLNARDGALNYRLPLHSIVKFTVSRNKG
jgi:alpha-L-arabinofuranosidase